MDVPEIMLYGTTLGSSGYPVTVEAPDHAARMSTPGAVRSGYKINRAYLFIHQKLNQDFKA